MKTVELYARVRRAVLVEGMSRRAAAREFGLARKTVGKMLEYSVPPGYQRQQPARRPKLGPWQDVIDAIVEDDKHRPRKQRHTAKRIFERLRAEHGYTGGYTIVKDYVRTSKIGGQEMFIPLTHAPGERERHVDVRTSRFCDFSAELVRLGSVERFADLGPHFKLELLLLAQLGADDLPRIAEHLQQKPDLFIDRFGSRALAQAIFLVCQNCGSIHIHGKFVPEQSGHMSQRVFGKTGRAIAQPIADQVFVNNLLERPNALLSDIAEVVKSFFQFTTPLLFGLLGHGLRSRPGGLFDLPACKIELVPPDLPSLKNTHRLLLSSVFRLRRARRGTRNEQ